MRQRTVLLDTSFVLALENLDDPHHDRAKSLDRELLQQDALSLLHWGILIEIGDGYARANRRTKGLQVLERLETERRYLVHPIASDLFRQSLALYRARSDKEWGLTDCVSFCLMEQERITEALTADPHFRQAGYKALLLEG